MSFRLFVSLLIGWGDSVHVVWGDLAAGHIVWGDLDDEYIVWGDTSDEHVWGDARQTGPQRLPCRGGHPWISP